MKRKKFTLLKDIVIPAGTVFEEINDDTYRATFGLSKNTFGDVIYYNDIYEGINEVKDWFELITNQNKER